MRAPKPGRTRRAPTQTRPTPFQLARGSDTPQARAARPLLSEMTPDQLRAWIGGTRAALERKKARERAYLDRRAARGTSTATDEAYEADQLLEADLLDMLTELERHVALMESYGGHRMNEDEARVYTLVPSRNRGRYGLDEQDG